MDRKLPLATLYLLAVNLGVYLVTSGFFPILTPRLPLLNALGLRWGNPLGLLTYQFLHLWLSHLLVACTLLLVFGYLVERRIGPGRTVSVYLASGVISGALRLLMDRSAIIAGSSGSVFGLIGAAVVVSPTVSVAAFFATGLLILPPLALMVDRIEFSVEEKTRIDFGIASQLSRLYTERQSAASEAASETEARISQALSAISSLEETGRSLNASLANGTLSAADYAGRYAPVSVQIGLLNQSAAGAATELKGQKAAADDGLRRANEAAEEAQTLKARIEEMKFTNEVKGFAEQAREMHVFAIFVGGCLALALCPGIFSEWRERYAACADRLRKKGRKEAIAAALGKKAGRVRKHRQRKKRL